jgi:hypothetical protein
VDVGARETVASAKERKFDHDRHPDDGATKRLNQTDRCRE